MTRPWGTGGPMGGSTSPPRRAGRCWRPERAILQPDGVTAVYSNLAQKTAVAVGDLVDTGAVLGEVGRTALAESGLEPHLHLELLADGEPVNPLAYLPKLN